MAINTARGMDYLQFIPSLCAQREVNTYLEVGVQSGVHLANLAVDTAFGVDPDFILNTDPTRGKRVLHLHRMTSDAFFRQHAEDVRRAGLFDFAFLDGLHLFEYLLRDFYNTESLSKPSSLITLHDCLPMDGEMIERVNNYAGRSPGPYAAAWTGDVWKVVLILEEYRPDLSVVLTDCAPTGLVCVSGLDPNSTVLKDRYLDIVAKYKQMPNDKDSLADFYAQRQIVSGAEIISNFNQSLYFRS